MQARSLFRISPRSASKSSSFSFRCTGQLVPSQPRTHSRRAFIQIGTQAHHMHR
jgi:hypothetical protein